MIRELLILALAWAPVWMFALWRHRQIRFGRVLFAAALVGFVGGACAVELRRHGLLAGVIGSPELPLIGLRWDEVLHFALLGAAGGIVEELLLGRSSAEAEDSPEVSKD